MVAPRSLPPFLEFCPGCFHNVATHCGWCVCRGGCSAASRGRLFLRGVFVFSIFVELSLAWVRGWGLCASYQGDVESLASRRSDELVKYFEAVSQSEEYKAEYEKLEQAKKEAEEAFILASNAKKTLLAECKEVCNGPPPYTTGTCISLQRGCLWGGGKRAACTAMMSALAIICGHVTIAPATPATHRHSDTQTQTRN